MTTIKTNSNSSSQQQRQQSKKRRDKLFALLKSDVVRMKSGKNVRLKKLDTRARRDANVGADAHLEKRTSGVNATGQLLKRSNRQLQQQHHGTADEIQCSDQRQMSGANDLFVVREHKRRRKREPVQVELHDDDENNDSDGYSDEEEEDEEAPRAQQQLSLQTPTQQQSLAFSASQSQSIAIVPKPKRTYYHDMENSPVI